MRTTRSITALLAAVLGAAALAGPAAADSHKQPDSAKANVYVPPAAVFSDTVAAADDSAKANVYVPPAAVFSDTVASAASTSSSGLDWGSAGIGVAVAIGAFLIALGGATGLRRRRQIQPAATG